jgi:KaiC/GvpD/RAD55 family RecA-like ATPase
VSALGEKTLMLSLKHTESVEEIAKHGLNVKVVPTGVFREVVEWTMTYYQRDGVAPTPEVLRERFGADRFSDSMIDLDEDVEETISWAIGDLEGTYVQQQVGLFTRKLALEIGAAAVEGRVEKMGELSSELAGMVLELQPRTTQVDIRESGPALLAEYEMAANTEGVRGMRLGIPAVDEHLQGIWDGELVTIGGPPGTGKSFLANLVAHNEWERGRNTTIFTLENSILMTQMRIACVALRINVEDLQTGSLDEAELAMLREWCNDVLIASDTPLNIINPDIINRSPQAIVQAARAYETESLIIDQLTHLQPVDATARQPRHQEIGTIVRTLANLIDSGRHRLPCLLMHQVNREGVKAANATGRLDMTHMAEGAEVERSSSVVMSLWASEEHRTMQRMQLQMLKQRRVQAKSWDLQWAPWMGIVNAINEVNWDGIVDAEAPA